jgi:hypothetical protein
MRKFRSNGWVRDTVSDDPNPGLKSAFPLSESERRLSKSRRSVPPVMNSFETPKSYWKPSVLTQRARPQEGRRQERVERTRRLPHGLPAGLGR